MKKLSVWALLPLYMVILLDVAGIILVMPVLTPLLLQPENSIVPADMPQIMRDFLYGVSLALFPLFMFFSTPVLGDLSDRYGRKKILLFCLVLSAVSYLVAAFGVILHSLSILLISRCVAGLAAGTQPIATAAIIDASTPENRSANLAWVVFSCSIGLILGPAVAGLTANPALVSWFGYDTPFWFAAGVCLLSALLLIATLKETHAAVAKHRVVSLTKGFSLFMAAFSGGRFRLLSFLYFCFVLSWGLYYQTINWILMEWFQYGVGRLGLFVAFIGVIFAFSTTVVVRIMQRVFDRETVIFAFSVFLMAVANIAAALTHSETAQWLWAIPNAMGDVLCYTMALAIFSSQAGPDNQGWIMGVAGAIGAMTWAIAGLIIGPLGYIHITVPLWASGGLCLLSFLAMVVYDRHSPVENNS